jgi:hypothetical protein
MAAKKLEDVCVVTIGYTHLLLPAADGLKVLALLRNAAEVSHDYDDSHRVSYLVGERPRCELEMVSAKQLKPKAVAVPHPRKPLLLGQD